MIYHSLRYDSLNRLKKTKESIHRLCDAEIRDLIGTKPVFDCYFLNPSSDVSDDRGQLELLPGNAAFFVNGSEKERCTAILDGIDRFSEAEVFLLYPKDFSIQKSDLDDYLEENLMRRSLFMARALSLAREGPASDFPDVSEKQSFSEYLFHLIDSKGMKDSEVYKRANIDRRLFSKMRDRDYIPSKKTLFSLCISMELNLDESDDLLHMAGYSFSKARMEDIIVEYFIIHGRYDLFALNEALISYRLAPLF